MLGITKMLGWKRYIALTRKSPGPDVTAAQLEEGEKIRRSTGYVFFGMRLPSPLEAQAFLTEACEANLGKRTVWRVEPYDDKKPSSRARLSGRTSSSSSRFLPGKNIVIICRRKVTLLLSWRQVVKPTTTASK